MIKGFRDVFQVFWSNRVCWLWIWCPFFRVTLHSLASCQKGKVFLETCLVLYLSWKLIWGSFSKTEKLSTTCGFKKKKTTAVLFVISSKTRFEILKLLPNHEIALRYTCRKCFWKFVFPVASALVTLLVDFLSIKMVDKKKLLTIDKKTILNNNKTKLNYTCSNNLDW